MEQNNQYAGGYPAYNYTYNTPYNMTYNKPQYDPFGMLLPQAPQPAKEKPMVIHRPVGDYSEARAMNIDFDGTVYFLEDKLANKLYKKQFIGDTVIFTVYEISSTPEPKIVQYAPLEQVEALKEQMEELIRQLTPSVDNAAKEDKK